MSDFKDYRVLSYDELKKTNATLNDIVANLRNQLDATLVANEKLQNELNTYTQCTARVYPPNKSYQELENKLALAENSKQTEIEKLYETEIRPLQNQVKDKDIKLESAYQQNIIQMGEIGHLKKIIDGLNTIVNYAAGYISSCEQFRDKHPTDVVQWLFKGLKNDK